MSHFADLRPAQEERRPTNTEKETKENRAQTPHTQGKETPHPEKQEQNPTRTKTRKAAAPRRKHNEPNPPRKNRTHPGNAAKGTHPENKDQRPPAPKNRTQAQNQTGREKGEESRPQIGYSTKNEVIIWRKLAE